MSATLLGRAVSATAWQDEAPTSVAVPPSETTSDSAADAAPSFTVLPSSLHGQVNVEHPEDGSPARLHVNARLRGSAPRGIATATIAVRDGRLLLPVFAIFEPSAPNAEYAVVARLDTSAQGGLLLSDEAAELYHPWIATEVEPANSYSPFEAMTMRAAALGGMRLGSISIEPAPTRVGRIHDPIVVGMETLTAFEGAVFDWKRNQLHLVIRRTLYSKEDPPSRAAVDALAQRPEWTTLPLEIGATTESFDSLRHVMISTRAMWPRVVMRIDGRPYTALIDTGYEGDVLLREGVDWSLAPLVPISPSVTDAESATSGKRQLRVPLTLGRLAFNDVTVETGWSPPPGLGGMHIDAIIGMGLLGRTPMWLDFRAGIFRLWASATPLPDLGVPSK